MSASVYFKYWGIEQVNLIVGALRLNRPHTVPPERLFLAHLAPYLTQTETELEGELKRLQSENEELSDGIQSQQEEMEQVVGGLEAFLADVERANEIMSNEVEGNSVKKEIADIEQDFRAAGREAKL